MFVHFSLNFVVLNLFHLETETAPRRRDSLTAVTELIRVPARIIKFSNNKTYYTQKTQRGLEKWNIYLKLMHETKMLI